jgi:hypothetical protein
MESGDWTLVEISPLSPFLKNIETCFTDGLSGVRAFHKKEDRTVPGDHV